MNTPAPPDEKRRRLERLLEECDVETYRGPGPGGQHRNRRDSAVRLTHRPTGIVVTATERRSQHQNRMEALERLAAKLAARARRRRPRVPTAPTGASRRRRAVEKARAGERKRERRPVASRDEE